MDLSVIIIIVDGRRAVEGCLKALARQEDPPSMEIIVPCDSSVGEVAALAAEFPEVRFIDIGTVPTHHSIANAAGQHELIDQRRAEGLEAARGDVVALLEDRGYPRPDWARRVERLHRLPHAAVGGAVENGVDRPLNWAVYFVDFAPYQLPFEAGPADYVSDVNVSYKAAAVEATRPHWEQGFQETTMHWALSRRGETLWLAPEMVVEQRRRDLGLGTQMGERFHWGRIFARTRVDECGTAMRFVYAALAPLLPAVLFARLLRLQLAKRRTLGTFVKVSPLVLLLLLPKALGEMVGYVTGKA